MSERVRVYGASWCADCRRTKRFLDRRGVGYAWVDIDADDAGRDYVRAVQDGGTSIPVVAFLDGRHLIEPADRDLAAGLKLRWPG